MKLPFARDVSSLLQKEIAAEAAATAKLADMRGTRAHALLEDDIAVIERHDVDIAALERQISIHQDRILALDARLHAEAEEARKKEYAASVAVVERLLPLRNEAAGEVEKAILAVAAAVRKYSEITDSIANQKWPANVVKPSYQLSLRPLGERLRNVFGHPSLVFRSTLAPMAAADFVKRTIDAEDRAAGFAAGEAKGHEELLIELRNRGAAPAVVAADDQEEAA